MTRPEFDAWIAKHYHQLLKVARQRVNRRVNAEPEDVLQSAVAGMLASTTFERTPAHLAWPWAVGFIRCEGRNARRSHQRKQALRREAKNVALAGPIHQGKGGSR